MSRTLNCAIYTRKSTEDGLDQDFNSLDAQRESCEAYITSQKSEGWCLPPGHYDDGGCSGGNMNRPALQRLLADVDAGKIAVVVVYKVDRLSRSLMDFSRIVDRLDEKDASFVSVTQSFNTSTSMGRLTLNVLLSFAQFEREVTVERIRDKIAASKKKGMWMGGLVPLGYDAVDKKLVVNEEEAGTVRWLFQSYLDLGNVRLLINAACDAGLESKSRTTKKGKFIPGSPFSRGQLYHILRNPVYIGKISHKGETYKGLHRAIIEKPLWDSIQAHFDEKTGKRKSDRNVPSCSWLNGLLKDDRGRKLTPRHTTKAGRRYRYYVTVKNPDQGGMAADDDAGYWRLPAAQIERMVLDGINELLDDPMQTLQAVGTSEITAKLVNRITKTAGSLSRSLRQALPAELAKHAPAFINEIRVSTSGIEIDLEIEGLGRALEIESRTQADQVLNSHTLTLPAQLKRRGVEMKLVLPGRLQANDQADQNLVRLVARAHGWFEEVKSGRTKSISEIAGREDMNLGDVSRSLPLAFLAPDIVSDIINGDHPVDLTAEKLRRLSPLPMDWREQRAALGFD